MNPRVYDVDKPLIYFALTKFSEGWSNRLKNKNRKGTEIRNDFGPGIGYKPHALAKDHAARIGLTAKPAWKYAKHIRNVTYRLHHLEGDSL
jgi:hypothetical protein